LGIESNTVARKLISPPLDSESKQRQIWIVDEAGLLNAGDTHTLISQAELEQARILFVGDTRQLSAVEAGNPFKSLQQAGMTTAYLNQSLRQKTSDLKVAVELISEGQISEGIEILDKNAAILILKKNREKFGQKRRIGLS
jgi:ATP-dependent exoDNAse (exonuclease V) alpha subunit